MISLMTAIMASAMYLLSSYYLSRCVRKRLPKGVSRRLPILIAASMGLVLHTMSLTLNLFTQELMLFSFGNALSLVGWIGVFSLLIISLNKPTETLGIFIFPLAAIVTFMPYVFDSTNTISYALGSHIIISVFAYSLLGLAAAQAILFSIQERRFQQRKLTQLIQALPPLQVMEKTLIQLVLTGFIVLSFGIASGAYFIENFFDQHLAHKTFFSLLAWFTYAYFLVGRFRFGWRGQTAAKFTLGAYIFLLISFIGTQLILMAIQH
ncbi:inner membrane protein YpjD [Thiomicrospira sp. ALE5]|uniref:cytochrome C assembly family protein n=1 Tax=Thiomicrospira sp. ALE5 TaxID=748650 RepID=UPI0008E3527D|nr:cytochrome c biogenesis protein CcsA [Thiomicrospira sp. ALE5]SFR59659.1 ABC-type uncharacterized transport system, permease component [Thiomicrospira sp. ALE5]